MWGCLVSKIQIGFQNNTHHARDSKRTNEIKISVPNYYQSYLDVGEVKSTSYMCFLPAYYIPSTEAQSWQLVVCILTDKLKFSLTATN